MPPEAHFAAIVLAAQRPGTVDPLATEFGLSHKCLVPVCGRPLIVHAVEALLATPGLERLRISVEPELNESLGAVLRRTAVPVEYIPSATNLADSVHRAAHGLEGRLIVTTADNVLLTPGAVRTVVDALARADVAVAMARRADVLAAHPAGQRRFYRFRDDAYSNCNLYGFAGDRALRAAESFRSGGQFAKKPARLIAAVGVLNVLLMLLGRLSLAGAMARLSRRLGFRVTAVVLADGAHAIDVDNRRTFDVATELLTMRGEAARRAAPPETLSRAR